MPVRRTSRARPARSLTLARTPASRARALLRAALAQVGGLVGNATGAGKAGGSAAPLVRAARHTEKSLAAPLFATPARGCVTLCAVPPRSLPLRRPNVYAPSNAAGHVLLHGGAFYTAQHNKDYAQVNRRVPSRAGRFARAHLRAALAKR